MRIIRHVKIILFFDFRLSQPFSRNPRMIEPRNNSDLLLQLRKNKKQHEKNRT